MPRVTRRRNLKFALLAATTAAGMAGCVSYQPWQLPDPYGYGAGSSGSTYYTYGSGGYGYGAGSSHQGYGYPYSYYRDNVPLPYPAYRYYPYPAYTGHYCKDNDRDGHCDNTRHDRNDQDHDRDDRDDRDDADNGGTPPRSDRPQRDLRRVRREREPTAAPARGAVRSPAVLTAAPVVSGPGEAPTVRAPARPQAPPPVTAPRAEIRRSLEPAAARPGPRGDGVPKNTRADVDLRTRQPLR
jgi:hypothetical protein